MATHGNFHWNELATSDVRKAKNFYGKLIGWKTQAMKMPGMTYQLLMTGEGSPAAGGMYKAMSDGKKKTPAQWLAYVTVADVDAAAAKVKKLGGKLLQPPFDIQGVGRICIIADPDGARLGLITPAPGGQ